MTRKKGRKITVFHGCPPPGNGLTPCCGKTPFELPRLDRMTIDDDIVNCKYRPAMKSGGK